MEKPEELEIKKEQTFYFLHNLRNNIQETFE